MRVVAADGTRLLPLVHGALDAPRVVHMHAARDQGAPRRFIYFSKAGSQTAETMLSETQQTMALVRQGGTLFGQFMTEMDYTTIEGETMSLRITPGEMVEGGQKISTGRIKLLNDGGWETVIPVAGLRACQPDAE